MISIKATTKRNACWYLDLTFVPNYFQVGLTSFMPRVIWSDVVLTGKPVTAFILVALAHAYFIISTRLT